MPDAIITSTESTFGTISGTFAADQSTVTGTIAGVITGTLTGSVGVPGPAGPQGPQGEPGEGVPAGGTEGQIIVKASETDYDTVWMDNSAETLTAVVRNETGATLTKGTVVYISGAAGNKALVSKASASSEAGSSKTFAILKDDILNNQNGVAVTVGLLKGLNTLAFTEGANLWLSTTPGEITQTPPASPNHAVFLGNVTRVHANQGTIEVRIQNGYELGELHDVLITSPTNGQVLKYDSATSLWKNGLDAGLPAGGTAGQFLQKIDGVDYNTDWVTVNLGNYLVKSNNLSDLTDFATARDNLSLGVLNTPTFAGVTVQGAGSNIANLGATFLTLNHTGYGQFTIQPSTGITFPDTTVQTTAFPAGSDMPTGGMTGQVLTKQSNGNYDADWQTISTTTSWGSIVGTLSSQTDLQNALNAKQNVSAMSDYLAKADNLSGLANLATSRTNLGLGTANTVQFTEVRAFGSEYKSYVTTFGFTNSRTYSGPSGTIVNYGILTSDDGINLVKEIGNPAQATATVKAGDGMVVNDGDGSQMTFGSTGITFPDATTQVTAFPGFAGYATESFVTSQGYITSSALTGYATESWVTSQGYLTSAPVTSVAGRTGAVTLSNTDISGLGTLATVNDAPSDGNEYVRKNAAWSIASGGGSSYITSVSSPLAVSSGNLTVDLSAKADLNSPTFTGTPSLPTGTTAVTQSLGDNSTKVATTAFVLANAGGGGGGGVVYDEYNTSGTFTWTKPAGAKWVEIVMFGGGGGGGSGGRYDTTSIRAGGGGGSGGGALLARVNASALGATETVVVGAGGTGGAARTTDTTAGSVGGSGQRSTFSIFTVSGGNPGNGGGSTSPTSGGTFVVGWCQNALGQNSGLGGAGFGINGAGASPGVSANAAFVATGGGGGGGNTANITASTVGMGGGSKLAASGTASGTILIAGGTGGSGSTLVQPTTGVSGGGLRGGGTGGGGGGYRTAVNGMDGAVGASPGGGGGGGSASDNGFTSGAGGAGGSGAVYIITYT